MDDIGQLRAEVELCFGDNMETHMVTTTTAIAIPRGTPRGDVRENAVNR